MDSRKSRQKRPIWRRPGIVRFAKTGWWCAQSDANRSPAKNREFFENFSEKQASIGLTAPGHRKLDRNSYRLAEVLALSCYFAKQAFEARYQDIRCSTSGFSEPQAHAELRKQLETAPVWRDSWGCIVDCDCR
jgi:hypothetical protein